MGVKTEELKTVAQIRKAIAPLIGLLKADGDKEITTRLELIEKNIDALTKRDTNIQVSSPDVTVTVPTENIIKAIEMHTEAILKKSEPIKKESGYEPHDQIKKGTFQYSGFLKSDGEWYIQRVAKGEQRYAKGTAKYAAAWDNLDNLKFGYLDG